MENPPKGLWGLAQYLRRDLALQRVFDYEKANNVTFDYIVMIRPDLYFFEPLPPASYLSRLAPEVVIVPKEGKPQLGDYMFWIPRVWGERWQTALRSTHLGECSFHMHGGWYPELRLDDYLKKRSVPFRVAPFKYVVTKGRNSDPNKFGGQAFVRECNRMQHDYWPAPLTQVLMPDASRTDIVLDLGTPETYCNRLFDKMFPTLASPASS